MPWDRNQPTNPKYATPEHRAYTASLKRQLTAQGWLECRAAECLMPTRMITNPDGSKRDGLTAGHMPDGVNYNGPEHRACNIREAAVRANARSHGQGSNQRWIV